MDKIKGKEEEKGLYINLELKGEQKEEFHKLKKYFGVKHNTAVVDIALSRMAKEILV